MNPTQGRPLASKRDEEGPPHVPLRSLQTWLLAISTHPESIEAAVAAAVPALGLGGTRALALEQIVTRGPRLSALERLDIYRNGYRERLVECLADDYPALEFALGSDAFDALARDYITQHPSRSPSLNGYGRHMSEYCRLRPEPWAAFAAELSTLEWALVEAVHAAESPRLLPDALASILPSEWPMLRLTPSDSLRLLCFEYPVNAFFQAFREGLAPELPQPSPSAVAVYRNDYTLWRLNLTPAMATLLAALIAQKPLGEALEPLEDLGELGELGEDDVMRWFNEWIANGFFTSVRV